MSIAVQVIGYFFYHLEMYSLMAWSATGIMGIGALVESQYDLSFLLA